MKNKVILFAQKGTPVERVNYYLNLLAERQAESGQKLYVIVENDTYAEACKLHNLTPIVRAPKWNRDDNTMDRGAGYKRNRDLLRDKSSIAGVLGLVHNTATDKIVQDMVKIGKLQTIPSHLHVVAIATESASLALSDLLVDAAFEPAPAM